VTSRFISSIFSLIVAFIPLGGARLAAEPVDEGGGRVVKAQPALSRITLDGILSEPDWKEAEPADGFIQRDLDEGAPATERTEVRILYDAENLYIGIVCDDHEPDRIIHTKMERDADLSADDNFTVVIDTYRDKRTGYRFGTNPNGVYKDALISNTTIDESWNGVWDVRARITDRGWSAEMVIPFKTFRFSPARNQEWGINFARLIPRKHEESLWTSWGRNDGILQLSKCGTLAGLSGVTRSRRLDFKPYVLGGLEKIADTEMDRTFKYGLDVKYPFTSQLTLDLTTLTDFAQVESDREQINLTRFDLNYPEKRDFFLEGSGVFEFGSPVTTPFYSRRIGIAPDSTRIPIPILAGARLVGKAGSCNIGAIEMQTDEKNGYPSTNYGVIRVKKDVLEKSYVGFIATNAAQGRGRSNGAFGADFLYRTDRFMKKQNFEFGGYAAKNFAPGVHYGNNAGRVFVNLPNDLYSAYVLYHAVGKAYHPDTGFVRRGDIRQYHADFSFTPRPGIWGIKKLLFMPFSLNYYTNSGTRLVTRTTDFRPFGVEFESGDIVQLNAYGSYDFVNKAISRFKGNMNIPVGVYRGWYYEFLANSSPSRPYTFNLKANTGEFYDGNRNAVTTELGMKTSGYYSLSADYTFQKITMNGRSFDVRDVGTRIAINFSSRLTTSSLIQYNNETGKVNLNFRLHYIPSVGSDIYLVYNRLWDEEDDFRTVQTTGIFKIAYLVRY
jgi:hypothetical protein